MLLTRGLNLSLERRPTRFYCGETKIEGVKTYNQLELALKTEGTKIINTTMKKKQNLEKNKQTNQLLNRIHENSNNDMTRGCSRGRTTSESPSSHAYGFCRPRSAERCTRLIVLAFDKEN